MPRSSEILESIPITGWAANGKALARVEGLVVFVTGAVPGDVADLRVRSKKKNYAEAEAQRIITPSPDRVEPFCRHFGPCGGCKWQHLRYEKQLEYKQQQVVDNLVRLGGLDLPPVSPILGSPRTRLHRNKLEFTASAHRWFTTDELRSAGELTDRNALGFHIPQRFDRVLQIDECHLQPEPSNAIRNFIRDHAREHGVTFHDIRAHQGFLRTVMIRTSLTGELMVVIAFGEADAPARERLLAAVRDAFPGITSLQWTVNIKKNDTIWDLDIHTFHGKDHVIEELHDPPLDPLTFRIGPKSFFQTNPEQALNLFRAVREYASLGANDLVYDLFCGAGSIALFLARHCSRVIGAEIVPEAVEDARRNAALNNITNVVFEAGDLRHLLDASFVDRHGRPDVLVTDPPRSGMHEDVVMRIREIAPSRIVYVSCNPATQARDLALLKDRYRITHVQPVDMFPHTHHVESVVGLRRIGT